IPRILAQDRPAESPRAVRKRSAARPKQIKDARASMVMNHLPAPPRNWASLPKTRAPETSRSIRVSPLGAAGESWGLDRWRLRAFHDRKAKAIEEGIPSASERTRNAPATI